MTDEKTAILDAVIEFMIEIGEMTPEEIDAAIREAGGDPEVLGLRLLDRLKERAEREDAQG